VRLPDYRGKGGSIQYIQDRNVDLILTGGRWDHLREYRTVASGFHLPEVCRQIYSETALTLYKENVFLIHEYRCFRLLEQLNEAQRSAITAPEASPDCLEEMMQPQYYMLETPEGDVDIPMEGLDCLGLQPGYSVLDFLPNFRKFIVTNLAARFAQHSLGLTTEEQTKEQLKAWVMNHFAELTDSGVEVIFEG
jgi:hypothetical protein